MSKNMIFCLTFLFIAVFAATPVAHSQTLLIAPSNQSTYDNWEPTNDGTLTFTVAVSGLSAASISAGEIRFDFEQVSNWEGTRMNEGSGTDSDLNFTDTDQTTYTAPRWTQWSGASQNVVAAWNLSDSLDSFSMNITVRCKDYGAFGILRAKLYNTSSSSDVFDVSIAIPKDDNGNYIADRSDTFYGYTNPALDGETGPDTGTGVEENNNPGDGLVQFEEYRGFKVNGGHKRLDPTRKDIFIYSPTVLGIGDATNLPFKVHEILDMETESTYMDRSVNYNSLGTPTQFGAVDPWYVQDTMALWVFQIIGSDPNLGAAFYTFGSSLSPVSVYKIEIYTDEISSYASDLRKTTNISATTDADAEVLQQARTIGHEIGHGVGLPHPWAVSLPTGRSSGTQGVGWYGFGDTSEKVTSTVYGLILDEAVARFKSQTPTTNFLDTSGSSWQIRLNSYVANRSLTEPLGRYTFKAGSSIMDYNLKLSMARVDLRLKITYPTDTFTQDVGPGIFRASTYHQLHNWEYQLLGDGVTPQTNPQWTPRTVSTNTSAGEDTDDEQDTTPTELGGSSSSGSVTLSWSAPTDTDETVTDYAYRYSENGTGTWSDWMPTGDANTSASISGLINGLIYMFQVRAYTMSGWGDESDSFSIRVPTMPNAPTNLSGSRRNGGVYLTWSTPSDDGGSTITYYDYRYSFSSGTFSSWSSLGHTGNSDTISGLMNGRQYQFQVRAVNSIGPGPESNTDYTIPAGLPSAPQNFETTAGDGEVTLTWEVPLTNNGSTITGYKYSYRAGTIGYFSDWTDVGNVLSTTVSGLTNDTLYQFRVLATNGVGDGSSWAGPEDETPEAPITTPGAPTGLYVGVALNGIVIFTWDAPSDDGGATIEGYEYQYREEGTSTWSDWTYVTYRAALIMGLTNGTTYEIQVRAVNSEGSGTISDILRAIPVALEVRPGAPQNLSPTAGDGQVGLAWDAPDFDGNTAITGYEYALDTNNDGTWAFGTSTGNGTTTSVTITGLTNGTEYAFRVRAVNNIGTGPYTSAVTAVPQGIIATVPTAPTSLSGSPHSTNVGWATLSWSPPSSDGGSTITSYEWRYCWYQSNGTWSSWSDYRSRSNASTSMTLSGLASGVFYGFQVRAVNGVGAGPGSNTTSTRGKE